MYSLCLSTLFLLQGNLARTRKESHVISLWCHPVLPVMLTSCPAAIEEEYIKEQDANNNAAVTLTLTMRRTAMEEDDYNVP